MYLAFGNAPVFAAQEAKPEQLQAFLAQLDPTPVGPMAFVERRMSALLSVPLELRGQLQIDAAGNIDKRIVEPIQERVRINGSTLVLEQHGRTRTLNLANDRRWRAFQAGITGLLQRDSAVLNKVFQIDLVQTVDGWNMRLTPRSSLGRGGIATLIGSGRGSRLTVLRVEQSVDEWQEMRFER